MIDLKESSFFSLMTFRRIAANTTPPPNLHAARARVLALYREWLREVIPSLA